jgi:dipeptidyl-peptidase-3
MNNQDMEFKYLLEQFSDIKIMRYKVPNFDKLDTQQKKLIYFLSQATLSGRDITFDQHYEYNLLIRKVLENIYQNYSLSQPNLVSDDEFLLFEIYLKKVWFSNGIHHHNSTDKFFPEFTKETWRILWEEYKGEDFTYPENYNNLRDFVEDLIFNPKIAPKRVSQDSSKDLLLASAVNFYKNISQKEVEEFYNQKKTGDDKQPISLGLNSQISKLDGKIVEQTYYKDGLYGTAIKQIIYWLEKASGVAENSKQKKAINLLISYYETGDLKTWDAYNMAWVQDLDSEIDFVNGFIEDYGDPLGMKATWESIVNFKDTEATKRTTIISENAQWFEDHSPIDPKYRKQKVKGVSAKAINVAMLGGDCYPTTPIGINLPNADWIRKDYGSKSVTIENITYAYDQASKASGFLEEFVLDKDEIALSRKYGTIASNLHTDLHECLGHGSGQLAEGTSIEALKNYASPLEEARADLFALYFLMDDKMQELALFDSKDVAKAEYNSYIRNGLMSQLVRVKLGSVIEQAHMRNRQLVASWCYEKGKQENVIKMFKKDGKTFVKINDYEKLRMLFGNLLKEIQRIKSEGDYEAGKELIERYAVQVDEDLHKEVLERFEKLNIAPYGGFVNPTIEAIELHAEIIDIQLNYEEDYTSQMLRYSNDFSFVGIES